MGAFSTALRALLVFDFLSYGMLQIAPSTRVCIMEGKFEILDGTCQNYYICIYDGVGFVAYDLKCSGTMVFYPLQQTCTSPTQYACTQVATTTPAPCVKEGRFEIKDPKCQKYYLCQLDGKTFVRYDMQCPNALRFNPMVAKCVLPETYPC